jgi:hypothetical protein
MEAKRENYGISTSIPSSQRNGVRSNYPKQ